MTAERYWEARWRDADAEIERLRGIGHRAFMAMCAQRDNPDDEIFQDAIDELGEALHHETPTS